MEKLRDTDIFPIGIFISETKRSGGMPEQPPSLLRRFTKVTSSNFCFSSQEVNIPHRLWPRWQRLAVCLAADLSLRYVKPLSCASDVTGVK